ncbi:phosphotransferase-like protein [Kribbella sp.]|uniref:phosphotransferase-like protein n=1 Tax=Kribbella sp. TaxID=1871183 RepID=UPI002D58E5CC|nr:AAA family ATPase [Kribbella sp.]HZX07643.1 AAA family ATPase [Kribbella sp.]
MTGRLIGLVGTSSVGKSTTARALQAILPEPYLVVGLDHFYDMFPSDWGGHRRGPGPGFWQETVTDPDGKPRIITYYGDAGVRMFAGMRAAVVALLDAGNNLILDEMPIDPTIMPAWRRALAAYDVHWIALQAPLEVIEERELNRNHGRHLGNARGHYGHGMEGPFDLTLDTTTLTPEQRATTIAALL